MKVIHSSDKEAIVELEKLYGDPPMDLSGIPLRALTLEMMRRGQTNTYIIGSFDIYKLTVLLEDDFVRQINGTGPAMIIELLD